LVPAKSGHLLITCLKNLLHLRMLGLWPHRKTAGPFPAQARFLKISPVPFPDRPPIFNVRAQRKSFFLGANCADVSIPFA
jgi:hypothetical protein